jgi:hypothetical protein
MFALQSSDAAHWCAANRAAPEEQECGGTRKVTARAEAPDQDIDGAIQQAPTH